MQTNKDERLGRVWRASRSYFAALLIFLVSRLIVALAIFFSANFVTRVPGDIFTDVSPRWYRYLLRWDAGWYLKIAREGYTYNGNDLVQQPVVFFPLYPLLSKAVAYASGISEGAALLIVSNLAAVVAILLLFKLISEDHDAPTALGAVAALCFFPTSFFFSAGYTESLAVLLIVTFFLLLKRKRYLLAALCVGLTIATRMSGVILCLPLVFEIWRQYGRDFKRVIPLSAACLGLATSGLWLYATYLWAAFGKPLAFMTDMRAWREGTAIGAELFQALTLQPFRHLADIRNFGPDADTLSPWLFLLFLLLIVIFRKWISASMFIYALAALLFPYLTLSASVGFVSFARYLLLAVPAFIIIGKLFRKRVWLGFSLIALSAAMLFMYAAFYSQWYWAG